MKPATINSLSRNWNKLFNGSPDKYIPQDTYGDKHRALIEKKDMSFPRRLWSGLPLPDALAS
ncbi:hypothetical protein KAX02_03155 [candidate division WOR-3 bacterium]|nr:hypothetical protein [candidate division WOR-3 bacterium]